MRSLVRNSFTKKALGSLLGAALCLIGSDVYAATITANGGSNNWNSSAAWVGGTIPRASDDVIIPSGSTISIPAKYDALCYSLNLAGNLTVSPQNGGGNRNSIGIGAGTSTITGTLTNTGAESYVRLAANGEIRLDGNGSIANGGKFEFGSPSLVKFISSSPQTVPALPYYSLWIENTSTAGATLGGSISIPGSLTIFTGSKLSNGGQYISGAGSIAVYPNAELILSAGTNISTHVGITTKSLDPLGKIAYSSGSTIPAGTYAYILKAYNNVSLGGTTTANGIDLSEGSLLVDDKVLNITGTTPTPITGASSTNYIKLSTGQVNINNVGSSTGRNTAFFPVGTAAYSPATITANTGTASQTFSVKLIDGVYSSGTTGTAITERVVRKVWDITKSGTSANVNLVLQWTAADQASDFTPEACVLSHYDGAKWERVGVPTVNAGPTGGLFSASRSNITTFSPFGVGGFNSTLPVELVSFAAVKKNTEVALNWVTASEKNNTGFEVQTSADGKNYETVAFVASQNGNATSTQRYAYTHKTGSKEGLVYYRLKQVDMDGTFAYYNAKVVDLGRFASTVSTFPNPFQNQFELNLTAAAAETAQITVTDMAGKTVYASALKLQKGANALKVSLENQPAGMYLLKATAGNQTYTNRLVKQ